MARANASGATAAVVADSTEHLEILASAAREHGTRIPVVVELDVAWRPLGPLLHVGVRRSPLRGRGRRGRARAASCGDARD